MGRHWKMLCRKSDCGQSLWQVFWEMLNRTYIVLAKVNRNKNIIQAIIDR